MSMVSPLLSLTLNSLAVFIFLSFIQQRENLQQIREQQEILKEVYSRITKDESAVVSDVNFRQIAAHLEKYHEELSRRNEKRLRLIEHAPHDFRGPLNNLILRVDYCLERLKKDTSSDNALFKEYLGKIRNSAKETLARIDNMLDMSKIRAGKFELNKELIQLRFEVEKAIQTVKPAADQKNISIDWQQDKIPMLKADPTAIRRVLENLLSNAIKFTPQSGYITISAKNTGDFVEVSICDTGIGIAQKNLTRIFEPYISTDGTGLGLSIAKGIIELHGGQIYAKNRPDGGSKFTFTLPL